MQDVDTAFLNKSDLMANVDTLAQEIEFLKTLYEAVRAHPLGAIPDQCLAWAPWGLYRDWHFPNILCPTSRLSNLYPLYDDVSTSGQGTVSRLLISLIQDCE